MNDEKPKAKPRKPNGIDAENTFRTQIQNGDNNTNISRTITINLIFTGEVPPDLAALIRDAILAAESSADGRAVKVLRRRVKSPRRQPPQNRS